MAKKLKKMMAMLLALTMIMSLVSIPALAEEPDEEFSFEFVEVEQSFSGEDTMSENEIVVLAEEPEDVTYDYDSNILYLTNADLEEGIDLKGNWKIVVAGDCYIDAGTATAITCDGALTIVEAEGAEGLLTLKGSYGIDAASVSIDDVKLNITGTTYGIYAGNSNGDAAVKLTDLDGSIIGAYAGIYVYGNSYGDEAYVLIDGCDVDVTTSLTDAFHKRAINSGITVYVNKTECVDSSIIIKNSNVTAIGSDAGLSINNYLGDPDATNSACSYIDITNSTVYAEGTNGTWSGIFASVLGQHPDADAIINITKSSVYAISTSIGIMTSSQKGEAEIILDDSILGVSGKTALSMKGNNGAQVQLATLKNGSTYVQMTPMAAVEGEIVVDDSGKTIIATAGDGITYDAGDNYYVIPQGSAVTERFTDGTSKEYTFNNQAGGVGGFKYAKEEVWGYDVAITPVCKIVETGVEYATLTEAVAVANTMESATIEMLKDIDFEGTKLSIKKNIAITGDYTISRGDYTGTMFAVNKGATLTLDDGITFDGDNDWTFDEEGFYGDMADGLTLSTDAKSSYTDSKGTVATAQMITIASGGAVVMNKATIQNSWADNHNNGALFSVPAGATLTVNAGALIQHIRSSVAGQVSGTWTMNGGKIEDVFGHNTNGGVVDIRNSGVVTINGGEITNVRTLGLNKNSNGILAQVYGESAKLIINGGYIHNNASFAPGDGWGSVVYLNRGGDFTMTGGTIEMTDTDHCSAFVSNTPTTVDLQGGTIKVNPSTAAWFDSLFYGNVDVAEGMEIVGVGDAFFCMLGDTQYTLNINGEINGGTMWLMHNQPVTGTGTVTSDVLIKADPSYFEFDGKVTITDTTKWLDSLITVDSVGSEAYLTVDSGVTIDGVQVRVLGSVPSADYTKMDEAKAEQAAAYIENEGATVISPVLYYHRLTADQKKSSIVVTYDYNGGLDAQGWSGCQITSNAAFVPTAPAPTMEGMKLAGWAYAENNDPECLTMDGTVAYEGETIAESVRLIAQWEKPDYVCYIKETGVYYTTLTAAVADANKLTGDNTIVMIKDIDFDSKSALTVKGNLTIISEPEHADAHIISRGAYTGTMFTVAKGNSLTLDGGIVFDGSNNWVMDKDLYDKHMAENIPHGRDIYNYKDEAERQEIYAYNTQVALSYFPGYEQGTVATAYMISATGGTVNMNDVTFQNHFTLNKGLVSASANTTVNLEGAQIKHCAGSESSGLVVNASGKNININIKDGTLIDGNHVGGNHGLFKVYSGAVANMSGGTISNTTGWNANGVVLGLWGEGSTFNMSGGTICHSSSVEGANNGRNAAIYLHNLGTMNMTGGTICHNISRYYPGGIDSSRANSTLNINRVDQYFVDGVYPEENGADAYTASNHPMVIDNEALAYAYGDDVFVHTAFTNWRITGGIYTQDVNTNCAPGYVCIPYEDTERTDDYIVVPGYRVNYYSVEKNDAEEISTTLLKQYFHLLPRDKYWYEMDERANYYELTDEEGGIISTWYCEKELENKYDFVNTKLTGDLNLYGEFKYTDEAAVVLTIDMSGTMYRYKMGGTRYVDVAKAKALDFVNQYAAKVNNEGDVRMLAIASFDTDAKVVLNWVNVNTADGLAEAKAAINGMKVADNGKASSNQVCTNFDGGIILTRNLLKQSNVTEIDNKFAIILSDGAPTVTVNSDTDTVGTIQSSFWGKQYDGKGNYYQKAKNGGGWTHPGEVDRTLKYLATGENNLADLTTSYGENKEGIFFVGVGGDMSVKLFNDAVYGTSNGTRTSDVKKKPAAFNYVEALQGVAQADIMKMTTGGWLQNLADRVGGTYASAANASALQNEFDAMLKQIVNS